MLLSSWKVPSNAARSGGEEAGTEPDRRHREREVRLQKRLRGEELAEPVLKRVRRFAPVQIVVGKAGWKS
jgi:hypothetical protein